MSIKRKINRVYTPAAQPGFLGAGHEARPVIQGSFSDSDPFIMLMDDVLDKQDDAPAGGPHPHAGFETVTLMLEGELGDGLHFMKAGDFQMMTAGSGIVHTETIENKTRMRLLQLWLTLPKNQRWTLPRVQDMKSELAPTSSADGVNIRLYSGSLAGLQSPVKNHVPLILAEIEMDTETKTTFEIPANFNAFIYVLSGSLFTDDQRSIKTNQVAWLNILNDSNISGLELATGTEKTRFVLYAAKPQGDPIVSYGPFIGDNTEDIKRLYQDYREGKMKHINTVPEEQRIQIKQ